MLPANFGRTNCQLWFRASLFVEMFRGGFAGRAEVTSLDEVSRWEGLDKATATFFEAMIEVKDQDCFTSVKDVKLLLARRARPLGVLRVAS